MEVHVLLAKHPRPALNNPVNALQALPLLAMVAPRKVVQLLDQVLAAVPVRGLNAHLVHRVPNGHRVRVARAAEGDRRAMALDPRRLPKWMHPRPQLTFAALRPRGAPPHLRLAAFRFLLLFIDMVLATRRFLGVHLGWLPGVLRLEALCTDPPLVRILLPLRLPLFAIALPLALAAPFIATLT